MPEIRAIFWDIGGVLLTNGWDREARRRAAVTFGLDWEDFDSRHQRIVGAFETGQISLDTYLAQAVFHTRRDFTQREFAEYMYSRSRAKPETLDIASRLARAGRHFMATINNESLPLNLYRIRTFGLHRYFPVFFSSCFLGHKKPERQIYDTVLKLTQMPPGSCVFIDDRPENTEAAKALGMHTIHYREPGQFAGELGRLGVDVPAR